MNTYTQEQEVEIVKTATELTATIEFLNKELYDLRAQKYANLPLAPTKKTLQRTVYTPTYPQPPKYTIKKYAKERWYLWLLLPTGFFWAVVFGYFHFKKKYNEKFYASKEYAQAKADEDARVAALQKEHDDKLAAELAKLDEQYKKEKEHYDTVTIPEYEKARAAWTAAHDKKIEVLQSELEANEEVLESLYAETKLISSSYRELSILQWLYEDMSTSDHDIRYATELLDRDRQRTVTTEANARTERAINRMNGNMQSGFSALYSAIEEGNEISAQTLGTLQKTRRDMNITNIVGGVQRHNISKNTAELANRKKK